MKNIKNLFTLVICCAALTSASSYCFFNGNSNALSGAAIGGLAGGRKGAAIGLGVGAFTDIASSANSRRYDDGYYNNNYNNNYNSNRLDYDPNSRTSMRNKIRTQQQEINDLHEENNNLYNQLQRCLRNNRR